MKTLAVLAIVVVAAAAAWFWWRSERGNDNQLVYDTAEVIRGPIAMTVEAAGTINPVATVLVGSQVSGRIQDLFADYNSVVTSGQVVAQLEESPFITRVRQCEAALAKAKARTTLAHATFTRQQSLAEERVASSAELDDARAEYQQAVAEEKQAQAQLDSANIDLEHATIYSPVDGMVLTRSVDIGQTVAATFQAPVLFTIASDLTKMQIEAMVSEADIGGVATGQTALFTVDAYPRQTFTGIVQQIRHSPEIVQNVVSYGTIIRVDNSEMKLRPGMTATTTIVVSNRDDVLLVPNAALRMQSSWMMPEPATAEGSSETVAGRDIQTLYIMSNGVPVAVRVGVGITDDVDTEIVTGLSEGQHVVVGVLPGGTADESDNVNPFATRRRPSRRRRP